MKFKFRNLLGLTFVTFAFHGVSQAAPATYDADTLVTGAQDGGGSGWNTTNTNFWNGTTNILWPNTSEDEAIFGANNGTAAAVTVGAVTANKITFSSPQTGNYSLTGGTITLAGTSPTITANADATIGSALAGTAGLVKSGTANLTLTGANTYTGATSVTTGILTISGAGSSSGSASSNLIVGGASGRAVLNLNSTSALTFANAAGNLQRIGGNDGVGDTGAGAINQSSGNVTFTRDSTYIELGTNKGATPTSYGAYNLSGGSLTATGNGGVRVGNGGLGSFTQTGGSMNSTRWFVIGASTNDAAFSRGVATFTGGTAVVGGGYRILLCDRVSSSGTLNIGTQAGGTAVITTTNGTGISLLSSVAGLSATLNLNPGTLAISGPIYRNGTTAGSTATVNLNGGTLRANGANGLITQSAMMPVNLFNGGLTVDTQGNAANIGANISLTTGNGLYPAGGIFSVPSDGGSGYIGAPLVAVSGGSGSGATATASVTNGVVTGITLTSPGQNYVAGDALTFTFSGGGASTAATAYVRTLVAADLAANGTGGLVKTGSGSLTLAGANTYTGPTLVKNGTLVLLAANATNAITLGDVATSGKLALGNTAGANNFSTSNFSTVGLGGSVVGGHATNYSAFTVDIASGTQTIHSLGGSGANENMISLVKNGTGTLAVDTSDTHTGTTTVNAGTLSVPTGNGTTGSCSVADGAGITVTGDSSKSWVTTNLTLGSSTGASVSIKNFDASKFTPAIRATDSLVPTGSVTINIEGIFAMGTSPLIEYPFGGGIGGAGLTAFHLGPLPRGMVATLVNDPSYNAVSLEVTAFNPLTWKGNFSNIWDINGVSNWTLSGNAAKYLEGDVVYFGESGSSGVVLNSVVAPASVTFENSTKDYTLSGTGGLSGTTSLTKTGSGTLTLTTANTNSGTTTVSEGKLIIGDGTNNGSLTGPLINDANVEFNPAGTASYSGNLSGTGEFITKTGDGIQVLAGATGSNSYGGTYQINGGTLQIGNGANNGDFGNAMYDIATGARLLLNYATAVTANNWAYRVKGAGLVELSSAQGIDGTAKWGPDNADATPFTTDFTGTLQINKGRFDANAPGLGGTSKIVVKNGGQFMAWDGVFTQSIEIEGNGWGEGIGKGLRRAGNRTTAGVWAGPIKLTGESGITAQRGTTFEITGSISGAFPCEFYTGDPAGENGTLLINPASGQNSYTATKINGRPGGSTVAGNANAFSSGPLIVTESMLKLNGFNFTFANLAGTGGKVGNYHAANPATITIGGDNSSTTYGGVLLDGGTAPLGITKTGSGTVTLSGANAYTGTTTVAQGTLSITSPTLGDASTVSIASGAHLDLSTGTATDIVGVLIVGDVTLPPGTYNSSHATYGSYFTGTGSLVIAGGYEAWATEKGLDATNNGATQDPDNDGLANLMEFYLNGNPLASDGSALLTQTTDANYLTLSFHRRDDAHASLASQFVQFGADLSGWTDVVIGGTNSGPDGNGVLVDITTNDTTPDTVVVRIPSTQAVGQKLFGRLKVVK